MAKLNPQDNPSPSNTTLEDASPMPFGTYGAKNGRPALQMQQVPAGYLLWLWDNPKGPQFWKQNGGVAEYIRQWLKVLMKESPDTIVTHF